jgi:voltage-gated potassium channel
MPTKKYQPFRKIYIAGVLFSIAILTGTSGYMLIEHYSLMDAVYMTIITVSTVGYGEVHTLSNAGRVFTIILIVFNLANFAYVIGMVSSYFLEGEFSEEYKLYKMKNSIAGLSGHIIICGFGRNGREAARTLFENGKEFVVIEKSGRPTEDSATPVHYYLQEDATRDETLKQAGIDKAEALLATLPEDADNLFVVLTARELNPQLKIISRASQDTSVRKLKTAGANNVIMPDKLGGAQMATMVLSPDVKEFVDLLSTQSSPEFAIREITCNRELKLNELNVWQKTGATVLGIKSKDGGFKLNPLPGAILTSGDSLIAMGSHEQLRLLGALAKE